jgi:excisionase family DNA binding protein
VEEQLLKVEEVCRRLSLGRSFVYRLIQMETLRSVRVGGARRILLSDLEDFMRGLKDEADE